MKGYIQMISIEELIYEWVRENFGQSEADDPSWNIEELANYLEENLKLKGK